MGGKASEQVSPWRQAPWLALALLSLLVAGVALAFAGALDNGVVRFDDERYMGGIPQLRALGGSNLRFMLTDRSEFYWHPLAYLVHAVANVTFGAAPRAHHAISVVLHGLTTIALFALTVGVLDRACPAGTDVGAGKRRAAVTLIAAAGATALWALHPLRVETVAWIAEVKDVLCALFFILALVVYLPWACRPPGATGRRRRFALLVALMILALAAKPQGAVLPLAMLALDMRPLDRLRTRADLGARLLEKWPLFVLAGLDLLINMVRTPAGAMFGQKFVMGFGERLLRGLYGYAFGVAQTLVPVGLVPFHPIASPADVSLLAPRFAGAALLVGALSALAVAAARRGRWAWPAAWAFYLGVMLPTAGFRQMAMIEAADRFALLPSVGLHLLAAGALAAAALRWRGARGAALLALPVPLALLLGAMTARQIAVWRDPFTFWGRVAERHPGQVVQAHVNLGGAYLELAMNMKTTLGDRALFEKAAAELRAALALEPRYAPAHNNLGLALERLGDADGAERAFREAVTIQPAFGYAWVNLSRHHAKLGRLDEARAALARAEQTGSRLPTDLVTALHKLLAAPAPH